jgi:outer membrane receptor protein involved in Fe transport
MSNTNHAELIRAAHRRAALWLGFALAAIPFTAAADDGSDKDKDTTVQLEKFEVTGSRIKRLDAEGPQPVITYTAEDMQSRGFTSVADFVQTLSFNSGTENSAITTNSFLRGANTINLRGLGSSRALVLINGRRGQPYGLTDSNNRSVFNFNSIPMEAVESIDLLKDGASAIYGSDAQSGVVNIRLKKNFSGLQVSTLVGNTLGHDSFTRSVNLLGGTHTDKTSVIVNVNWEKKNSNFIRDYDRSKTTNYTYLGTDRGSNLNSTLYWPANVQLTAAQAAAAGLSTGAGYYYITSGQPTSNPTKASFSYAAAASGIPETSKYDFANTYQLQPDTTYASAFTYLDHKLSDRLTAFAQLLYINNYTYSQFTPGAITSTSVSVSTALSSSGTLIVPSSNPYNPFGVNLTNFFYRASFLPVRAYETEENSIGLTAGLRGDLPFRDWSWESALSSGRGTTTVAARNQIKADDMQNAFNGTLSGFSGIYLNPFGDSNPDLLKALLVTSNSNYKDSANTLDFTAGGSLFTMPGLFGLPSAGDVSLATGAEWRKSRRDSRPDTTSYVGAGGGSAYIGNRKTLSEYAELSLPVVKKYLELQLALRHEDYSDFGETTNPKFAFVSQPLGFLKLRGSYAKTFTAPSLGQLYSTRTTGFTSSILDPLNPTFAAQQYKIITGGNPNLQPETGKNWYGGIVLDFGEIPFLKKHNLLKGLSLAIDYSNILIDDYIVSYTNTTTIFTYFPNRVIRDSSGAIVYFEATPNNVARYAWKGVDYDLTYLLPGTSLGDFRFNVTATNTQTLGYDNGLTGALINYAGYYAYPKWTGNASVNWRKGRWGAGLSAIYKGAYWNSGYTTAGWGENPISRFDGTLSYRGFFGTDLTLGCQNLFDTQPPPNGRVTVGFDDSVYGAWSQGRYVYLKATRKF